MYARCPFFISLPYIRSKSPKISCFHLLLFLHDQHDCSKEDSFFIIFFFQYIYAVYMCFKSSPLTLAALCSLCVQPGRCSQRGSSTRAGAAATARRSRPILRVSKTNEPVWRAAQAAEVLHLFQSQQRLCQEAGHHIKNLL